MTNLIIQIPTHGKGGRKIPLAILFILCVWHAALASVPDADTTMTLREVEVMERKLPHSAKLNRFGNSRVDRDMLIHGMRILGESDAIRSLLMLPGFNSISDYSQGISANGSGYGQVSYVYGGAPVFFPYHFGGFFSTFNSHHVSSVEAYLDKRPHDQPDRLGAAIVVHEPREHPEHCTGAVDIGLISATASIHTPAGLSVSARRSFLNWYTKLLSASPADIPAYDLTDVNATYSTSIGKGWQLNANMLLDWDNLRLNGFLTGMKPTLKWGNMVGSVSLGRGDHTCIAAYVSNFHNIMSVDMEGMGFDLSSRVTQCSAYGWQQAGDFKLGGRIEYTYILPQNPRYDGFILAASANRRRQERFYGKAYAQWRHGIGEEQFVDILASVASDGSRLLPGGYVSYVFDAPNHTISVNAEATHQYLHQVGMSDIGMPSNFWIASTDDIAPQRAFGGSVNINSRWARGMLVTNLHVYGKRVLDEAQYNGSIANLLDNEYDPFHSIAAYDGYNVGASLTAQLNLPQVSAWVGVDAGWSRRLYPDGKYRASVYEPLFGFKSSATWRVNDKLELSAYFTAAAGRPYTPVMAMYFIASSLITEYGAPNSKRLPPYHRLDLSATLQLKPFVICNRTITHFLNFSIMNVYNHDNVELQYFRYDRHEQEISVSRPPSIAKLLPSVSYAIQF